VSLCHRDSVMFGAEFARHERIMLQKKSRWDTADSAVVAYAEERFGPSISLGQETLLWEHDLEKAIVFPRYRPVKFRHSSSREVPVVGGPPKPLLEELGLKEWKPEWVLVPKTHTKDEKLCNFGPRPRDVRGTSLLAFRVDTEIQKDGFPRGGFSKIKKDGVLMKYFEGQATNEARGKGKHEQPRYLDGWAALKKKLMDRTETLKTSFGSLLNRFTRWHPRFWILDGLSIQEEIRALLQQGPEIQEEAFYFQEMWDQAQKKNVLGEKQKLGEVHPWRLMRIAYGSPAPQPEPVPPPPPPKTDVFRVYVETVSG